MMGFNSEWGEVSARALLLGRVVAAETALLVIISRLLSAQDINEINEGLYFHDQAASGGELPRPDAGTHLINGMFIKATLDLLVDEHLPCLQRARSELANEPFATTHWLNDFTSSTSGTFGFGLYPYVSCLWVDAKIVGDVAKRGCSLDVMNELGERKKKGEHTIDDIAIYTPTGVVLKSHPCAVLLHGLCAACAKYVAVQESLRSVIQLNQDIIIK